MDCSLVSARDQVSVAVLPAFRPWLRPGLGCPGRVQVDCLQSAKETGRHVDTVALDAADFSAVQQLSKGLARPPAFFTTTPQRYKSWTCLRRLLKRRTQFERRYPRRGRRDQVLRALYGAAAQRTILLTGGVWHLLRVRNICH